MSATKLGMKDWGGWTLDQNGELAYPAYGPNSFYPIDMDRFTTSAHVLGTTMQVAGKSWATDRCLAGFVRALNDILLSVRAVETSVCRLSKSRSVFAIYTPKIRLIMHPNRIA